jgi:hypothetical protein
MSHSTHGGFSGPPARLLKCGVFLSHPLGGLLTLASWAIGVGHIFTAVRKFSLPCAVVAFPGPPVASDEVGVGHMPRDLTTVANPSPLVGDAPLRLLLPQTVGVGHNPDPLADVRCASVDCSEHTPSRMIPHRGQVSENSSETQGSEHWAVLHKDVSRSYLANDARHLPPESGAGAVDACAVSSGADVLAGKPSRNDINTAAPRSSVKGSHVIPDGKRRQASVVLSRHKNACGVGVALDGADGSPPEQVPAEDASTSAREKSQLIEHLLQGGHCSMPG